MLMGWLSRFVGWWVHGVVGGSVLDGPWLGNGTHVLGGGKISYGLRVGMRGLVLGDWRECVVRRYWVMCPWRFGVPWKMGVSWMVSVSVDGECVGGW